MEISITYREQLNNLKSEFIEIRKYTNFARLPKELRPEAKAICLSIPNYMRKIDFLLIESPRDCKAIEEHLSSFHKDLARLYELRKIVMDYQVKQNEKIISSLKTMDIRDSIIDFAFEMEQIMRKHDEEKGDSWKQCDIQFLKEAMDDEFREWSGSYDDVFQIGDETELIDVANGCMMLWNRIIEKKQKINEQHIKNRYSE